MARISWSERIARGVARGLTPSQAAGRPRTGERRASEISGRPLLGAAKRGAEARASRTAPRAVPVGLSWRPIPGGQGRYIEAQNSDVTRLALEEATAADRKVIIHIHADQVITNYPDPRTPNVATISEIPADLLLRLMDFRTPGQDAWAGLVSVATGQSGKGYSAIIGVRSVEVKAYPR
jgi:hypothetical protein